MSEDLQRHTVVGPGSVVAGYRIESQIGAGGMAEVFRARDERLQRLVALKVIASRWVQDPEFQRRFIAEARAAAKVDDPNVILVYEAGEDRGLLFIAMRLVDGYDLRELMRREGPMPPARALEFLTPAASALDAAHRAGLIHRDVKPANILVHRRPGYPDHVYLSDFGLSKSAATGAVSLTDTGQFLGTPHYSSPEQCQGHPVDGTTDQYALACVAYQMLAGHVPFERADGLAILYAHISEPPPPLTGWRPDLPASVDPVLAKALAKSSGDRYPTCRDFIEALCGALRVTSYGSRKAGNGNTPDRPPRPGNESSFPPPERDGLPATGAEESATVVSTGPAARTSPRPRRPASRSGVELAATILCTISSMRSIWGLVTAIAGTQDYDFTASYAVMSARDILLGNGVWGLGDILVIIGTILMWSRKFAGWVLAIIGLSMVLLAMFGFELVKFSHPGGVVVGWGAYPTMISFLLSLVFALLSAKKSR